MNRGREERNGKSSQPQHDEDQPRKDKKIIESRAKYNPAMVNQTKRNDESGGDTDVLENSDQEVTAVNLSAQLCSQFK